MTTQNLPFLDDRPNVPQPEGYWMREPGGVCDQCSHGDVPGECCTMLTMPITPSAAKNPDVVNFFALHGVQVKWFGELPLAILPLRCSALAPNGDCTLFGQESRPKLCIDGPITPWAAQLNKSCSYSFTFEAE